MQAKKPSYVDRHCNNPLIELHFGIQEKQQASSSHNCLKLAQFVGQLSFPFVPYSVYFITIWKKKKYITLTYLYLNSMYNSLFFFLLALLGSIRAKNGTH